MAYLSSVGPLARSAGDLRTALRATAGPEAPDAVAYTWRLAPPRHTGLAGFRVGGVVDQYCAPLTGDVGRALSDAVDELARAGATIVTGWPDGVDPIGQAESFGFEVAQFFAFHGGDPDFATQSQVVQQHDRRTAARAAWYRHFADVDVFLCPATFSAAFAHPTVPDSDRLHHRLAFWMAFASLTGLPAVSAPVGHTPGGLPIGAQIIGPPHEDDTPITFAELAAEVLGGFTPPPMTG
jgi:amidase